MSVTDNKAVNEWLAEMAAMTKPDSIVWIDGTEGQLSRLREQGAASGEIIPLNEEKLPGCYLHRSAANDVARVEGRTFICSRRRGDAGPTNNWEDPSEMYAKLRRLFEGSMAGRVMYAIPFSMAVPDSPFAKFGIELTDSIYVVLNMAIVTRVGTRALECLEASGDPSDFTKGLHSLASMDPENRYIAHFPEDNAIWSVNSGYGGNALLGKKCLALRLASRMGRDEGWLAEHMLILGIENPRGEVHYIAGAFPSACGKTNLAMLVPPEMYQKNGYRAWCVGDDIAWLRVGADGRLWAVNPEVGFFGVAPGMNMKSNPNAMMACHKNTIFTNVAHNLDDNTVWWEKMDDNPPRNAHDWKGDRWDASLGTPGAHPNSRFTAPAAQCPCISPEFESPVGVPISAIVFGGRRSKGTPLVYQARDWDHGVFIGSAMSSESTAAATGAVGVVRHDPMAMLPFCGYHMGDYFAHWLDMGQRIPNPPGIFHVNWFRRDESGGFLWPGFGENMRVIEWIINRVTGNVGARETPIGFLPRPEDIHMEGLDVSPAAVESLLAVDRAYWLDEASGIREFYSAFGDRLPARLTEELDALERNLR